MPDTDHREVDRHAMPCRLAPVFHGATDGAPVHPPDLSTRGMFINTPDRLSVGSLLQLQFRLALTGFEVAVEAEVRHIVEGVGVGVEFVNLSLDAERSIEREIQAAYPDYGSSENRRTEKRSLLSNLPRRMWNIWIHGKEAAGIY
jgi:hypothetical protein